MIINVNFINPFKFYQEFKEENNIRRLKIKTLVIVGRKRKKKIIGAESSEASTSLKTSTCLSNIQYTSCYVLNTLKHWLSCYTYIWFSSFYGTKPGPDKHKFGQSNLTLLDYL